jgi:hypothetical protein
VDSLQAQALGPGSKTTAHAQSSSIPVLTGPVMQVPKPKGPGQRVGNRHASNPPNPFVLESQWEQVPHFPLAPAFTFLHPNPKTPETQTGWQHLTSTSHAPRIAERSHPIIETRWINVDGNKLTDDGEIEREDPMEMMNRCDGVIWDECPYTNHRLRL